LHRARRADRGDLTLGSVVPDFVLDTETSMCVTKPQSLPLDVMCKLSDDSVTPWIGPVSLALIFDSRSRLSGSGKIAASGPGSPEPGIGCGCTGCSTSKAAMPQPVDPASAETSAQRRSQVAIAPWYAAPGRDRRRARHRARQICVA